MARGKKKTEGETTQEAITEKPELVETPVEKTEGETKFPIYRVVSEFRDRDNFNKRWKVGEDVSHFDSARISNLVENRLVKQE